MQGGARGEMAVVWESSKTAETAGGGELWFARVTPSSATGNE